MAAWSCVSVRLISVFEAFVQGVGGVVVESGVVVLLFEALMSKPAFELSHHQLVVMLFVVSARCFKDMMCYAISFDVNI